MPSFTYLHVPVDESLPLEEHSLKFTSKDEVGCLMNELSTRLAALSQASGTSSEASAHGSTRKLLEEEAKKKGMKVDSRKLDGLASMQLVQVEQLQAATPINNWTTVTLYCDDTAVAKNLLVNTRATALCLNCGKSIKMLGDVFVARAQDDNNELYKRLDFYAADFDPDAHWVQQAKLVNQSMINGGYPGTTVTAKQLAKFESDLEKWVQTKLKEWDSDATAKKKYEKKYGSREGYEAHLRAKVQTKLDEAKA